ncbi:hypothetical protein R3W88_026684 [Solanum pinnatisectum]|uniref:Uncharacterized protein n=1 Tax=Solanum pinnatisectum TaxID=50273 RepID=A0AAV9LHD3_9SOLN|nr:hypothetical protein R3W88_026684 [Solanum pinnatisectum]
MGEPSNAIMHLNKSNPSDYSFSLESIDRCDQLQDAVNYCAQIVNNNVMGDERVGELHSDEPFEHEFTDNDEMSEEEEEDVDYAPNAQDKSVNHQSIMIPYLDHTKESAEDFIYTRDDGSIQTTL